MKVVLELQEQLANVRRVTVRHDIVIGRGSDCNLRLSAPQMSRRHCFLRVGRDGVSVTDLDSSNGTYVDNKRITPGERVELVTGSILSLGPVNFIVHLKEDSGSSSKSEGERSRSRSKSKSGAAESSTIVSSASAIIAAESKRQSAPQSAVEQAGASAEAHDETAPVKRDQPIEAFNKGPTSTQKSSPSRAEIADAVVPVATSAAAAALVAAANSPLMERNAKAETVDSSSVAVHAGKNVSPENVDSESSAAAWLADESPDDLSFFGGESAEDALPPTNNQSDSGATGAVEDVVEELVEVLEDEDYFSADVVEAVAVDEPVDVVEVLDEEPVDVVELLDVETPANALTADFVESDLRGEQFSDAIEEPVLPAEEPVEAELIEEVVDVVDVLDEPSDFFDQLGIVEDELPSANEQVASAEAFDSVEPADPLVEESVDAELIEETVDVVDVLEEPSDFFDQLGIVEDELPSANDQVATAEAFDSVEVVDTFDEPADLLVEEPVEAELVEEVVDVVDVLEEPSDFFDQLGIVEDELPSANDQDAAAEVVDTVEVFDTIEPADPLVEKPVDAELVEETVDVVEVLEEPSDFFDQLGIVEDELPHANDQVAAAEVVEAIEVIDTVEPADPQLEEPVDAELTEETVDVVDVLEEPSDFFDQLGIVEDEPQQADEQIAAVDSIDHVDPIELVDEVVAEPAEVLHAVADATDDSSDFFAMLGIEIEEPQQATEQADVVESLSAGEESADSDWFSEAGEDTAAIAKEQSAETVADDVELFEDVELLEEADVREDQPPEELSSSEGSTPEVVTWEQAAITASGSSWDDALFSDAAEPVLEGKFDFLNEDTNAVAAISANDVEPSTSASSETTIDDAVIEEYAEHDAAHEPVSEDGSVSELESAEEFDYFDDVEALEPTATGEDVEAAAGFDAEAEDVELFEESSEADQVTESGIATEVAAEVMESEIEEVATVEEGAWDFAEVAAEEIVMTDEEIGEVLTEEVAEEEVLEVVEEDEGSNWFNLGHDKSEGEDDPELREFLKGF